MALIWFILIGLLAGFLAGLIMRSKGFGCLLNLLAGVTGSMLGGWISGFAVIAITGSFVDRLICAIAGAVVLLLILSQLRKK